jgi:hypothetical protein
MEYFTELPTDELSLLELDIARRADEIARDRQIESSLNLHCWLVAETEVLARNAKIDRSR